MLRFIVLSVIITLFICIQIKASQNVSPLDAAYRLTKISTQAQSHNRTKSFGVDTYTAALSKAIFSECTWYPSDSQYAQLVHQNCGAITATLLSFERFSREHDAFQMTQNNFVTNKRLTFEDLPYDCELF